MSDTEFRGLLLRPDHYPLLCGVVAEALAPGYRAATWLTGPPALLARFPNERVAACYQGVGATPGRQAISEVLRLGALWQRRPIFGADLEVVVDGDTEKRLTGWEGRGVMLTPFGLVLAISVGVTDLRHRLPIGPSYDAFLARLGGHTRRNVRNSMRDAGRNGFTWCIEKDPDPRWPALLALGRHGHPEPYDGATIDRVKRLVTFLGDPFWAFLIAPDGSPASCCIGFRQDDTAFVVLQMNHADWLRRSPCLTNRSFLVRHLANVGVSRLVFVRGATGVLQHSFTPHARAAVVKYRRIDIRFVRDACGILAQATRERFRALCQGTLQGTRLAVFGACAAGARGVTGKAAPRR